jgi:carbamoyltransferase
MIPAIIHYDGTSRIQTVSSDLNPMFYSLISKFFEITGIPMVLNTSLNIDGMPLASRFDEALKVFFTSGLDILIADSLILSKEVLL